MKQQQQAPFPLGILVDQGLADKFLQTQLRPEALEAACGDGDAAGVAAAMTQLVPALARWARTLSR